jgi:purine-nucleoside phosphorylase
MLKKIIESKNTIHEFIKETPDIGIVLGSGLGIYSDYIENKKTLPFSKIPHFHAPTIAGHTGELIFGNVGDKKVIALKGRIHAYEGHSLEDIVLPVRTLGLLGIKNLFVTNASGGINSNFHPGDLVLIEDHINLSGKNPLVGPNIDELGPRFPDMSQAYNIGLRQALEKEALKIGIKLKSGVYCWLMGPTYETPAEIRMLAKMGADMVGMSTVPEIIVAHHQGIKVAGVACITNYAAGLKSETLNHDDVKLVAQKSMAKFAQILTETIKNLDLK